MIDNPPSVESFVSDQRETCKYKVFVGSWNVGGVTPPDCLNMDDWLGLCNNECDIYVLGFQELVPLSAGNILTPESVGISTKWNSLIQAALNNRRLPTPNNKTQDLKVGEKQKVHPVKDGESRSAVIVPRVFKCIISKQMVGIFISVWVTDDLQPFVRNLSVSCVGCGIMGFLGNKGSVSVRFRLHGPSFCFVCSHLASGGKEGAERHRNSDAAGILSRTAFRRGSSDLDLPQKILDHDHVVWFGDLNYRISMAEEKTRWLVGKMDWQNLLENDQLRAERTNGGIFNGWKEGPIEFAPTYKYYPNSDKYYDSNHGRRRRKRRAPAWCDRILWYGGLKQIQYGRSESRLSDHRPVQAIFTAETHM